MYCILGVEMKCCKIVQIFLRDSECYMNFQTKETASTKNGANEKCIINYFLFMN